MKKLTFLQNLLEMVMVVGIEKKIKKTYSSIYKTRNKSWILSNEFKLLPSFDHFEIESRSVFA